MADERINPEHQTQDTLHSGVDLVREIANEFGISPYIVRSQIVRAEIKIDGRAWDGDKLFVPYSAVYGKWIEVNGPDQHWRFQYRG